MSVNDSFRGGFEGDFFRIGENGSHIDRISCIVVFPGRTGPVGVDWSTGCSSISIQKILKL